MSFIFSEGGEKRGRGKRGPGKKKKENNRASEYVWDCPKCGKHTFACVYSTLLKSTECICTKCGHFSSIPD